MKHDRLLAPGHTTAFWIITVATCACLLITAALGKWQLARAAQKEALAAEMVDRAKAAPLSELELRELLIPGLNAEAQAAHLYRQVVFRGQWLPDKTVFLDNRQMEGKVGFIVLTPFQLESSGKPVVLVQRGWAQRNFEKRLELPQVATPIGVTEVSGHLAGPPGQTFALGSDQQESGFNRIRQNLNVDAFSSETGLPLAEFTLVQEGEASDGLMRRWTPASTGVDKHYGYAFQWFALFALILGLYVWFQLIRPCKRA